MKRKLIKLPAILCPDCGSRGIVRSSEQITPTCREARLWCENDRCAAQFVVQIVAVRVLVPSLSPNPAVKLPLVNQNLRTTHLRPANDDAPRPANDDRPPVTATAAAVT